MDRDVFDTVVFVRALINPYSYCGRLVFEHAEHYQLVVSPPIVAEVLEVLRRPELTRKFRRLASFDTARVLQIISESEVVEIETFPAVSRDPKDDKFLATAKSAAAAYLVSEDNDLLILDEYEGTRIVSAARFLSETGSARPDPD